MFQNKDMYSKLGSYLASLALQISMYNTRWSALTVFPRVYPQDACVCSFLHVTIHRILPYQ
jgi:hypothetical protein